MILALETATSVTSVAVINEGKLAGEFFINTTKNHSQSLMPLVDSLLGFIGVDIDNISAFAAAIGPGSFTGLRIGLATVKGMGVALNKPVLGIPTLDGLAENLRGAQGLICPILDARKNQVYTALYTSETDGMTRLTEYMAINPHQLLEKLSVHNKPVTILGDAVGVYRDIFNEPFINFAPQGNRWPRAAQVAQLAWQRYKRSDYDNVYTLAPLYIRRSEAEIRWEEKNGPCRED